MVQVDGKATSTFFMPYGVPVYCNSGSALNKKDADSPTTSLSICLQETVIHFTPCHTFKLLSNESSKQTNNHIGGIFNDKLTN